MTGNPSDTDKSGFTPQRQEGFFSLRVKTIGGRLTGVQLEALSKLAETYGRDEVHITSSQDLEIPFIRLEALESVRRDLAAGGLFSANTGPGLRTLTACLGADVCRRGLAPTQGLAAFLDECLDGRELPGRFKIGLSGCHNNCLKAESNDIGLKGGLFPLWSAPDRCTFCGLCQKVCPAGAITVGERELAFDSVQCVQCGRCYNKCPQGCWNGRGGWHLSFGGLYGDPETGRRLMWLKTDEKEISAVMNKALEYYRRNGQPGERFSRALQRLGWENFEKFMKSHGYAHDSTIGY